uniref:Uncharacterized protein n=1 Tax=Arundo donax TaxID=35708 RepID=A0A0A9ARW1_ARUDO
MGSLGKSKKAWKRMREVLGCSPCSS